MRDPTFSQEERSWLLDDALMAIRGGDLERGEVFLKSENGWHYRVVLVEVTSESILEGEIHELAFVSENCYVKGLAWIFKVDRPYCMSEVDAILRRMRKNPIFKPITIPIEFLYDREWS